MITAEGERQLSCLRVRANDLSDGLADARYAPRVLEHANGRVVLELADNPLKLVVSVELDVPPESLELLGQTSANKMNRALIDSGFRLRESDRGSFCQSGIGAEHTLMLTWPPLWTTDVTMTVRVCVTSGFEGDCT